MFHSSIRGQGEAVAILDRALLTGRISHAYLFVGPDGVGKRTCAVEFARALNDGGSYHDVTVIAPDGATIKIEQVRAVRKAAGLKPQGSGWRVWIFEDSETMTEEAANALLKTLEEPPPRSVFILIAADPLKLLPTIVSRCQVVRFNRVPLSDIQQILKEKLGIDEGAAKLLAALSDGMPGKAIRLAGGSEMELRNQATELAARIGELDVLDILEASAKLGGDRDKLRMVMETWLTWYRDLLVLGATGAPDLLLNMDKQDLLGRKCNDYSPGPVLEAIDVLQRSLEALRQYCNVRLCADSTLLRLNGILGKGISCR